MCCKWKLIGFRNINGITIQYIGYCSNIWRKYIIGKQVANPALVNHLARFSYLTNGCGNGRYVSLCKYTQCYWNKFLFNKGLLGVNFPNNFYDKKKRWDFFFWKICPHFKCAKGLFFKLTSKNFFFLAKIFFENLLMSA